MELGIFRLESGKITVTSDKQSEYLPPGPGLSRLGDPSKDVITVI